MQSLNSVVHSTASWQSCSINIRPGHQGSAHFKHSIFSNSDTCLYDDCRTGYLTCSSLTTIISQVILTGSRVSISIQHHSHHQCPGGIASSHHHIRGWQPSTGGTHTGCTLCTPSTHHVLRQLNHMASSKVSSSYPTQHSGIISHQQGFIRHGPASSQGAHQWANLQVLSPWCHMWSTIPLSPSACIMHQWSSSIIGASCGLPKTFPPSIMHCKPKHIPGRARHYYHSTISKPPQLQHSGRPHLGPSIHGAAHRFPPQAFSSPVRQAKWPFLYLRNLTTLHAPELTFFRNGLPLTLTALGGTFLYPCGTPPFLLYPGGYEPSDLF